MAKDPALLFYYGSAAEDVCHMNRLERGCYFDLLQSQRKYHRYTVEQVRKILGKDFEECWPALESVLSKDENGKFFIEWVENSTEKRKEHAEKQRERIQNYWNKKKKEEDTTVLPKQYHGITVDVPLEEENVIVNENIIKKEEKGVQGENESTAFREFKIFLSEEAPKLLKVKQPFTEQQFEKINGIYPRSEIESLCREMQNYEPFLKKYTSAYLTFMSWMGRRTKTNDTATNKNNREPVSDIRATLFKNRFPGNSDGGSYSQVG